MHYGVWLLFSKVHARLQYGIILPNKAYNILWNRKMRQVVKIFPEITVHIDLRILS